MSGRWVVGRCVEKAGGLHAGILLAYLIHRMHGPMRPWGGKRWVARSREEYVGDTGLSLDQYKRALRILKLAGQVESKRRNHDQKRPVMLLRLTDQTANWARDEGLLADDAETEIVPNSDSGFEKLVRAGKQAMGRSTARRAQ